jgi:hypothetical protein
MSRSGSLQCDAPTPEVASSNGSGAVQATLEGVTEGATEGVIAGVCSVMAHGLVWGRPAVGRGGKHASLAARRVRSDRHRPTRRTQCRSLGCYVIGTLNSPRNAPVGVYSGSTRPSDTHVMLDASAACRHSIVCRQSEGRQPGRRRGVDRPALEPRPVLVLHGARRPGAGWTAGGLRVSEIADRYNELKRQMAAAKERFASGRRGRDDDRTQGRRGLPPLELPVPHGVLGVVRGRHLAGMLRTCRGFQPGLRRVRARRGCGRFPRSCRGPSGAGGPGVPRRGRGRSAAPSRSAIGRRAAEVRTRSRPR